jgi:hypothetical protein
MFACEGKRLVREPGGSQRSWGVIGSEIPMSNLHLLLAEEDEHTRTFLNEYVARHIFGTPARLGVTRSCWVI